LRIKDAAAVHYLYLSTSRGSDTGVISRMLMERSACSISRRA
jgi:hypothetical protein